MFNSIKILKIECPGTFRPPCIVMQEASDALSKTADSDTVSTYQVSSLQLVTDKCLNLKCAIYSVRQLHFGIKRLFPIVSSIALSLTDLDCYLAQYQVFAWVTFILCYWKDNLTHLPLAIPSEACSMRSNKKVRDIIHINDFFTVYHFHEGFAPSREICILPNN